MICRKKTALKCRECGVYVCLTEQKSRGKNHWETFHSKDSIIAYEEIEDSDSTSDSSGEEDDE